MVTNTINLHQSAAQVAKELAKEPDGSEIRAKFANGILVLYCKAEPTGLERLAQNLFAKRKEKLALAHRALGDRLKLLPDAAHEKALKHCRWQNPSVKVYQAAFSDAAAHEKLPARLHDFLSSPLREIFMPQFRAMAEKAVCGEDLDFVLKARTVKDMPLGDAQRFAARLLAGMCGEVKEYNVAEGRVASVASQLVDSKKTWSGMTAEQWRDKIKEKGWNSAQIEALLVRPFADDVTTLLHNNFYRLMPNREDVAGGAAKAPG